MACNDVDGRFNSGRLTPDTPGTVPNDPFLTFSPAGNGIVVTFDDDPNNPFNVVCAPIGQLSVIQFTRTQPGPVTTAYTGLVARINAKRIVRIKGRFVRTTGAPAVADTMEGDWETEKPT
jgi:hypothetical protein